MRVSDSTARRRSALKSNSEVSGIVLLLVLVLVLDQLAIRAEKRARSFRNRSVPATMAAERAVFSITSTSTSTSTISNFGKV